MLKTTIRTYEATGFPRIDAEHERLLIVAGSILLPATSGKREQCIERLQRLYEFAENHFFCEKWLFHVLPHDSRQLICRAQEGTLILIKDTLAAVLQDAPGIRFKAIGLQHSLRGLVLMESGALHSFAEPHVIEARLTSIAGDGDAMMMERRSPAC